MSVSIREFSRGISENERCRSKDGATLRPHLKTASQRPRRAQALEARPAGTVSTLAALSISPTTDFETFSPGSEAPHNSIARAVSSPRTSYRLVTDKSLRRQRS